MIYKGSGMFDDDGGTPFQFDHNFSLTTTTAMFHSAMWSLK